MTINGMQVNHKIYLNIKILIIKNFNNSNLKDIKE